MYTMDLSYVAFAKVRLFITGTVIFTLILHAGRKLFAANVLCFHAKSLLLTDQHFGAHTLYHPNTRQSY